MWRQAIELAACIAMGMMLVAVLGGESTTTDGGESTASSGEPYNVEPSAASFEDAGWEATETEGLPDTYAGVPQVGYLEISAPDGESIDLQFFESPEDAQSELDETKEQEAPFDGTTIGNVLAFDPESETAEVSPENLEGLRELLK